MNQEKDKGVEMCVVNVCNIHRLDSPSLDRYVLIYYQNITVTA